MIAELFAGAMVRKGIVSAGELDTPQDGKYLHSADVNRVLEQNFHTLMSKMSSVVLAALVFSQMKTAFTVSSTSSKLGYRHRSGPSYLWL